MYGPIRAREIILLFLQLRIRKQLINWNNDNNHSIYSSSPNIQYYSGVCTALYGVSLIRPSPFGHFASPVHFISSLLQLPPPLPLPSFQPPDMTSIMIPLDPRRGGVLATLFLCLAPSVLAHGDHGHNVPEGSAVSEDPIVCCCQTLPG